MSEDGHVVVGDVGGTHARFAVVDTQATPWRIDNRLESDLGLGDFEATLKAYLDRAGLALLPNAVAIAAAGPVTDGRVKLTNRNWQVSEDALRGFGFAEALVINDFAALAFSVEALEPKDVHTIGPERPGIASEPVSIVGAGTGFGAACLARFRGRAVAIATEGGHATFAPIGPREFAVAQALSRRFSHVSVERVLSGPGLENLFAALGEIDGRPAVALRAADIVARQESDTACRDAVTMFCAIYGSVAGDFALVHGARGGVYLAGGIAAKIEPQLQTGAFRERFEAKGRLSHYVQAIPTRLVLSEDTAFLGAANASLEFRAARA
jgi:glucokinase